MSQAYDIIGDIHGCSLSLCALLKKLDYKIEGEVYRHVTRKIIFLGDFIDRGPGQREVINIVRPMIDAGTALSVMGNHEYNAIAYATRHPMSNEYLRCHSQKNLKQHREFLDAYAGSPEDYARVIEWFKTLPLWLDLGKLRVIHACWDAHLVEKVKVPILSNELLVNSSHSDCWEYNAIETLLKGKEIPLKNGLSFNDKDGNSRTNIRVRWWDPSAATYQAAFMGPESARPHISCDLIEGNHFVDYKASEPPVILGHYWFEGQPEPLASNIACVDYSIAKQGGKLVAYQWDGEQTLGKEKFVWVDRLD